MSSLPKQIGEADINTNVGNPGMGPFNAYHQNNFKPFVEDKNEEYLEEDNIKFVLIDYSNWIATTAIPKFFDEDLKSNRTFNLNTIILDNYIIKFILMLKGKFPKHCAWEESEWITSMIQ